MNATPFKNKTANIISAFLHSIGIPVHAVPIEEATFLPGIRIIKGELYADESKMYPGDLLHEAGHLAVVSPEIRKTLTDTVVHDENMAGGEEMGAIAWSWAALKHLKLPPEVLFHSDGYKGGAESLIDNFENERYIGVPILQWKGLCIEKKNITANTPLSFPHMIKWTVT